MYGHVFSLIVLRTDQDMMSKGVSPSNETDFKEIQELKFSTVSFY